MKKVIFILFLFCLWACQGKKDSLGNPTGYDLGSPEKLRMREALLEISGIAFTDKDELYALEDEEGQLYRVALSDGRILYSSRFGKKGDYEDVAVTSKHVVVLRSDGALLTFAADQVGKKISKVSLQADLLPKGEYEGLYAKGDSVYVLCKDCAKNKGEKYSLGYTFAINEKGKLAQKGNFKIAVQEICEQIDKKKLHFRPSAFAQHPKTNDWYFLSSVNRLLVVTDAQWKVKEVCPLPHSPFLQPEGIAFDSKSNLYVSNEGDEIINGSVFKFAYRQ